MRYFSERMEDAYVDGLGILPEHGTYVDVGASHPYEFNNTAFLHRRGWQGLSIDAIDYSDIYDRPFVCAVISDQPKVKFRSNCNPALARVCEDGEELEARTLEGILQEHGIGKIDFLSIDCEGHEFECFQSMKWEDHRPALVLFEYRTASFNGGPDFEDRRLHSRLQELGYRALMDNGVNCLAIL